MRRFALLALVGGIAASSHAANITYNDFSNTVGLQINGDAAVANTGDGAVLRLTPANFWQAGSAFSTATTPAANFSTYFKFRITNAGGANFDGSGFPGADGLVFVVQTVANNVGGGGGGIGYLGISNSIGIEFDTWNNGPGDGNNSNHIGININGSVNSVALLNVPTRFDDGNIWHAWIDYDGTTLEVRANQTGLRPVAADLTHSLPNIAGTILGSSNAYVGFTSGTGAAYGNHDVLSWQYRDSFAPIPGDVPLPIPAVAALALFGGLGFRRRKAGV